MPRTVRQAAPGALHHIISRFLNRHFLLTGSAERAEYLRRVSAAWARSDCRLLGYALMSSHVHWVLVAGEGSWSRFLQPLHTGFALWLNGRSGRLGPVFAGRPTVLQMEPTRALSLLAYVHNNPVRAGVVACAADSTWTSHAAYVGLASAPAWLDVARGLTFAGCGGSAEGRRRFGALVDERCGEARSDVVDARLLSGRRTAVRKQLGPAVELATARQDKEGAVRHDLVIRPGSALRDRWCGPLAEVIDTAARHAGVAPMRLHSPDRARDVVAVRRIVLLACVRGLGRSVGEAAEVLGISVSAASQLLRPGAAHTPALHALAARVSEACRRSGET